MPRPRLLAALALLSGGCHLALPLGSPRDGAPAEAGPVDLAARDGDGLDAAASQDGAPPFKECPPPAALDNDTLALFAFDSLVDLTGKHTVTLTAGAGLEADAECGSSSVAHFPGTTDSYGEIPAHPDWQQLKEGSVDLWFRLDQPGATEVGDILSRDAKDQALPGHLTLIRAGEYLLARLQSTTDQYYRCGKLALDQRWHHVGINLGPPDLQMFVDGKEIPTGGTDVTIPAYGPGVDCGTVTTLGIDGNDNPWILGAGGRGSKEGQATPVTWPSRVAIDNLRISSVRRDFDAEKHCRSKYGASVGFIHCESTALACVFSADLYGLDCSVVCAAHGGSCLGAWDNPNDPGDECVKLHALACDDKKDTNICVCAP